MKLSKPSEYVKILLEDLVNETQILTKSYMQGYDDHYHCHKTIQEKFIATYQEIQGILEDQKIYSGVK